MKENCLDIGTLQAFMDGELPHDQIGRVSDHLERCDSCAFILSESEDEASLVFSALDREFNTLVPTQRLWTRINESIEIQHGNRPFWEKAGAFLASSLTNPPMVAAAGLLIVLGGSSILLFNREPALGDVAAIPARVAVGIPQVEQERRLTPAKSRPLAETPDDIIDEKVVNDPARVGRAVYRPRAEGTYSAFSPEGNGTARVNGYFEGEESYVRTITSLARTVDEQKDAVLRPSERVAYERDMAVVNDSIARMRDEIRRNPRNETAKQVLYSSYQNKIDLLSSVSQKEELMASLQE